MCFGQVHSRTNLALRGGCGYRNLAHSAGRRVNACLRIGGDFWAGWASRPRMAGSAGYGLVIMRPCRVAATDHSPALEREGWWM